MTLSDHAIQLLKAVTDGEGNKLRRTRRGDTLHLAVDNTNISTDSPRFLAAFDQLLSLGFIHTLASPSKSNTGVVVSIYVATAKGFEYADNLPK